MSSHVATKVVRIRNPGILITKTLLMTWIINQKMKGIILNQNLIETKALSIFKSFEPFVLECQKIQCIVIHIKLYEFS